MVVQSTFDKEIADRYAVGAESDNVYKVIGSNHILLGKKPMTRINGVKGKPVFLCSHNNSL